MSVFQGRATFLRFEVDGPAPRLFGEEHLERLAEFQAGRSRLASADGIEVGWTAGEHVLDTDFQLGKNIIDDMLTFDLRIDTDKLPNDLLKAYYSVELKAASKENPSGKPSARQKREAKEAARERLEQEGKDGRFRRRKCIPVVWDLRSNEVLFGATSFTHLDRLSILFQQTFAYTIQAVTAGRRAYSMAELHQLTRNVDDSRLSLFVPNVTPDEAGWIPDDSSRDFIGNEFLMWLWFNSEGESDTIKVADGTLVTYMIARTLTLECPRGQTGHETISHEGPSRLPEAKRAIQSGKLPRKLGLTLVRHDYQYELSLHAETLAVGSLKFPGPPEDVTDGRAKLEERAERMRHFLETLDLLYDAFSVVRFGKGWADTLPRIQKWLARDERKAG
jgi:hypothetical protein